jgi:hypothetical protein
LVDRVSGLVLNSFEKQQAALASFQQDYCANPGNRLTNMKKEIQIQKKIVDIFPVLENFR